MLFVFHIERISNVIDYFLLCVKKFNLQSIILAKLFQVLKTPLIYLFVYVSGKVIPRGQSYKLPLFFEPFFTLEARFWKEMESRSCYNARHCVIILDPFALLLSSHTALNSQRHVINWQIGYLSRLVNRNFSERLRFDCNWIYLEAHQGQTKANEDWNWKFETAQTWWSFP